MLHMFNYPRSGRFCPRIVQVRVVYNNFPDIFVWEFKIVVDSWKFSIILLYILRDDWRIFMISSLNEQLQQQLEYTLLKPDCHNWWISEMQSDTLEEWYAIKFCFKLGKMPQKRIECFRLLLEHLEWIDHKFLNGIRDSRKAGSLWGMMRGVGGVRKSIHHSWLAKELGLGLGLLCWGFKGVQEKFPLEEARSLQIGSVAFPPGQWTSPQLHPCHRLFDHDGHEDDFSPSLQSRLCSIWFLLIPSAQRLSLWDNWGGWKRLRRRSLTHSHMRTSMGPFQKFLERYNNGIAARGDYFEGD